MASGGANGYVKINVIADTKRASAALNALGKSGTSFSQKMASVGRGMTYGLTLPIAAAGAASVKLAFEFEESMNKIKTLVGASTRQMKTYESAVLAMAPKLRRALRNTQLPQLGARVCRILPLPSH